MIESKYVRGRAPILGGLLSLATVFGAMVAACSSDSNGDSSPSAAAGSPGAGGDSPVIATGGSEAGGAPQTVPSEAAGATTGGAPNGNEAGASAAGGGEAATGGRPGHVYVMTSYKMWVFDLATPDVHTEIAPGVGASPAATYGTAGIYEPFDIAPDGKHVAVLSSDGLHIAALPGLTDEVVVSADTWARAPRFSDDGSKVRFVRRLRTGGGRFDDVAIVEVPLAGGTPSVVRAMPDDKFNTDLDRYVWKWDGTAIVGHARLEGRPDNTAKAHGVVTIDAATGVATLHTKTYGASFFTFAQNAQEPGCTGDVCVTVHDGATGINLGAFTTDGEHFLPDGRIYFSSNRDQYVKGGAGGGARKFLVDAFAGGDYETLPEYSGDRPVAYTRDGGYYATFAGSGATATVKVSRADGTLEATLTGFNTANVPTSVRFAP